MAGGHRQDSSTPGTSESLRSSRTAPAKSSQPEGRRDSRRDTGIPQSPGPAEGRSRPVSGRRSPASPFPPPHDAQAAAPGRRTPRARKAPATAGCPENISDPWTGRPETDSAGGSCPGLPEALPSGSDRRFPDERKSGIEATVQNLVPSPSVSAQRTGRAAATRPGHGVPGHRH